MLGDLQLPVLIVIGIVVLYLMNSIKILREYERGVIFRLGRVLGAPKGPGIILVFRPIYFFLQPLLLLSVSSR